MDLERPDLSNVSPDVRDYIEALEAELLSAQASQPRRRSAESVGELASGEQRRHLETGSDP